MKMGLLATKVGMTQIFVNEGVRVPVTVLQVKPNVVLAHKTMERDGYTAIQFGYGEIREKLLSKAEIGHSKKAGAGPMRDLCEFRVPEDKLAEFAVGTTLGAAFFANAKSLDISGTSKGKGFAGVMKRHHFSGFPGSHGTHEYFRHGGSIGMRAQPGKVLKGKRMAGQMGNERVTQKNLRIVQIMEEEGLILVRGAVPGSRGKVVELRVSNRAPRALHGVGGAQVEEASKNPMKASKAGTKAKPAAAPKKK